MDISEDECEQIHGAILVCEANYVRKKGQLIKIPMAYCD